MSTVELRRWLGTNEFIIPGLTLKPIRYSKRAIGGPFRAELVGEGTELAMWNGISALGAGVIIYSDLSDKVWWGQIYEVILVIDGVTIHSTLDEIRNRIKLIYTTIDPITGEKSGKQETAWEYDTESILRYGLRELVISADGISETEAVIQRHSYLMAMKDTTPEISLAAIQPDIAAPDPTITFYCRGWWDTLDARYYKKEYTEAGYSDTGVGIFRFGTTTQLEAAQSFQIDAAMDLKYVTVALSYGGSPTDTVVVKIYSDSGGSPNSLLGTSEAISYTALTADVWSSILFTFASTISLSASTTYWIVLDRSGSNSDTNFYTVDTNQDCGYADGVMKYYTGAAWASPSTAQDMLFSVSDGVLADAIDSTALIKQIIEQYGTVVEVNTADVIDESGVDVSPYRDGSKTALAEITELLEKGTTNYRRVLARVLENKRLEVYEEPEATASGLIDRKGKLYDLNSSQLRPETCPVAIWVGLRGIVPMGASFGKISAESCYFVEESEYDVLAKTLSPTMRKISGRTNFMVIGNG